MKKFYDIHMHIMDLSHPNLSAFLLRDDLIDTLVDENMGIAARAGLWLAPIASFFPNRWFKGIIKYLLEKEGGEKKSIKRKISDCLTFFEIPVEYQFLLLDYFLKNGKDAILTSENTFSMGQETYDKIVLCPLVMDFGYKNITGSEFYNLVPTKPIAKQVGDLLYAIRTYYRFNLVVHDKAKKMRLSPEIPDFSERKHEKLFEIYPFMGLDTRNYRLEDLCGNKNKKGLLEKYFANFSATETASLRRARLFEKMGKLDNNMHSHEIDYNDIFAGIKVYPQLGFNPYPEVDDELFAATRRTDPAKAAGMAAEEMEKVQYLYRFCCEKRIPITTHCSDGGFKTGEYDYLTNPATKWSRVLENFPTLTLNFAHFGNEAKSKQQPWRQAIIELARKYEHVYTDISCNAANSDYYNALAQTLREAGEPLGNKMLFGSDFSINLLASSVYSYNQYLQAFIDAGIDAKEKLCTHNTEKFLFGETIQI